MLPINARGVGRLHNINGRGIERPSGLGAEPQKLPLMHVMNEWRREWYDRYH